MNRTYQIDPRAPELGGGWQLKLIENGEEAGGGVFPLANEDPEFDQAYQDALDEGEAWVAPSP